MKHCRYSTNKLSSAFFSLCTIVLLSGFAPVRYNDPSISIKVCRQKEQAIKLTPNPAFNGTMCITSETKADLHFYVFDIEGAMLYYALLQPGSKKIINTLQKGVYSYDVFRHDEGIEQGEITVR